MILQSKKNVIRNSLSALTLPVFQATLFVSSLVVAGPLKVFADDIGTVSTAIHIDDPLKSTTDLKGFMANILDGVVLILTPVVVIMVVYSGFLFVSAQGNTEKLKDAKKALTYTLLGAALVIGAKGLQVIIGNTLGAIVPVK